MTIRRSVNIDAMNSDYTAFEEGVDSAPEGLFSFARNLKFEIGEACDDYLRAMTRIGAKVCNCDGIREIEVMMFAMIRDRNPDSEITQVVGFGRTLRDADPFDRSSIIRRVERDKGFYATRAEWQALGLIPADEFVEDADAEFAAAVEREALPYSFAGSTNA